MRKVIAVVVVASLFYFTVGSWVYARLTYEFVPFLGNSQILYERGAEDLAKSVNINFAESLAKVVKRQYLPFKDVKAIRIYVFNDRKRYAAFSRASALTRGSATTHEVYLSERLREQIVTLPHILAHELSHVHIRQHTGAYQYLTNIPSWFLEGLAVSVSSGGGAENVTVEQAQMAIRNGLKFEPDDSGRLLGPKSARSYGLEPHMYYRQANVFVDYLNNLNPVGFEAALKDVLNGTSFQEVWKKHYGQSILELWLRFEKSLSA